MTTVVLDGRDIVELVGILECLAGSLRAADHAGALLPSSARMASRTRRIDLSSRRDDDPAPSTPRRGVHVRRPALVVFLSDQWGPTGWCGISDGGAKGPCAFCGGAAHSGQRCPRCQLRL